MMRSDGKKLGIIDAGGGTRGIFGAGVLDRMMEMDIMADTPT